MNHVLSPVSLRSPVTALCSHAAARGNARLGRTAVALPFFVARKHTRFYASNPSFLTVFSSINRSRLSCTFDPSNTLDRRFYTQTSRNAEANTNSKTSSSQDTPQYEDWKEYEPQYGVPLPNGTLDQASITQIFGPGIDVEEGNHILCVLQYRRLSGSLIELGASFPELYHEEETYITGLEYLRNTHPVDEETAANEWVQRETERLEKEVAVNRAVDVGIYQRTEQDIEKQQGTEYGRERYGTSAFEEIRKQNEAKWEEEQDEKKKLEEQQQEEMRNSSLPKDLQQFRDGETGERLPSLLGLKNLHELRTTERIQRNQEHEERSYDSTAKAPVINMPLFKRLGSSTLVTMGLLAACAFFAEMYTPPPTAARLFPDTSPATATCLTLAAINIAVFSVWRIPQAWKFLNRTVIVTPAWPRAAALLGSIFSHQTGSHLLTNMAFLAVIGPPLHDLVGRGCFLAVYVASGVFGAYSSLLVNVFRKNFVAYSQGASGALYGVLAVYCLTTDKDSIKVPFTSYEVPFYYAALLGLCVAVDIAGLVRKKKTNVDHVAHLAGYTAGAASAWVIQRQVMQRKKLEEEKLREMEQESVQSAPNDVNSVQR